MALYENNNMGIEMDLEVFEIDGDLLRELLEEKEGKKDDNDGKVERLVESVVEEGKVKPNNMMDREQEQQQKNCLEPYECHSIHDFEWLKVMDMMMESRANNPLSDVTLNWSSDDDIVGMVDFGYANGECYYSQMCDALVSNGSYGCLWENYDI